MNQRNMLIVGGVIYVTAWIIGLILEPSAPTVNTPAQDLVTYYATHQTIHAAQAYLIDGIAGIALLVFAAGLWGLLQKSSDEYAALAHLMFGAAITASSVSLVQAGAQQVLSNSILISGNPAALPLMLSLINQVDTFKLLALALFSGAASSLILKTHSLPSWLGWFGLLLSILLILGGLSFITGGQGLTLILFASLPALLVWILAISATQLRNTGGYTTTKNA